MDSEFDWVTERVGCSACNVLENLRLQVAQDIQTRQGMRKPSSDFQGAPGFSHSFVMKENADAFSVSLMTVKTEGRVTFSVEDDRIKVTDEGGKLFIIATPSLDSEGQCIVRINKQEYPLWRFRMMALERLFFGIYTD